ncbi:MAG: hypothetical protein JNK34_06655, partial [Tabrizicola sp.]|nr:hypothetical protein [Tabrizicola sp.]
AVADLAPLASRTALRTLTLRQTAVADLTPLARLIALQSLWLSQTAVADLTPLASLTALQSLWLDQTIVADLAPLAGLVNITDLSLDGSQVIDLRPIKGLTRLGLDGQSGLAFASTPATAHDARLAELAAIKDTKARARETLAYLNTLPPWPEPYTPKARPDGQPPQLIGEAEPEIPASRPAPLQVVEIDGELRPAMPGDGLDENARLLARQAWAALRDYLADLAPLRPRLQNQMPNLSRAFDRFETALGAEYPALNAIALGIHGNRITRLTNAASESLGAEDAEELAEFAAAVALFLARFGLWQDYRRVELPAVPGPEQVAKALPPIDAIVADLFNRDAIAAAIPEQLSELELAVREAPDDALAVRGLFGSLSNLLGSLAQVTLRGVKAVGRFALRQTLDLAEETRKLALKGIGGALLASAVDMFVNKATILKALAVSQPEWFWWVPSVLRMFGL